MATTIVPGPGVYYELFTTGQGVGADNYFVYAQDMDVNFVTLRQTVNQLVAEVRSIQGPNAQLASDVEAINDPTAGNYSLSGRVGDHSFFVEIQGGDTTKLDLSAGQFLLDGLKVDAAAAYELVGAGGAGTRWVALDINGVPALELLAAQRIIDIASVNWDGAQFTGAITELVPILFDGDEWASFKSRPLTAPTWLQKDYRQGGDRVLAIERLLAGQTTDGDGDAVGPISLAFGDGTLGAPSISFVNETDSGLYRLSGGGVGFVVDGTALIIAPTDGFLDFPEQPMATATGTVNASASGAWDAIPFVTVEAQTPALQINTGGGNPERFTVATGADGDYVAHVIVVFDETTGTGAGTYRMARLVKDLGGSPTNYPSVSVPPNGGTAEPTSVAFTVELPGLVAGDHLTVQGRQDDGAILDMDLRASFRKVA